MSGSSQNESSKNLEVIVGEASNQAVTIKTYQDIYHQITGRTEQIRERINDNLLIDINEIEILHHKIIQLCDVHHVIARNETISLYQDKERREQFTSFERFKIYNSSSNRPTTRLILKYNFSIMPPLGSKKPQEYVITIHLMSRVAMYEASKDDSSYSRPSWISYMYNPIAELTIDYVDYVVARNFNVAFGEWAKACKATPLNKFLSKIKKISHHVSFGIKILSAIFFGSVCFNAFNEMLTPTSSGYDIGKFAIVYLSGAFVFLGLMGRIADWIEYHIDELKQLSYLQLSKGDENLIEKFKENDRKSIFKLLLNVIYAIVIGIISTKLSDLI